MQKRTKLQKRLKPRTPVTIIIGIKCKDEIVLACDSQTTSGNTKRIDTDKIVSVEFKDGKRVLVAQAGCATTSSRAIEILADLASKSEFSDYRSVADLAQQAMRSVKEELRFQNLDCSVDDLRRFIWEHELDCELMIAQYYKAKPYIFCVDMVVGIANLEASEYATLGCGSNLASFLLSDERFSDMGMPYATVKAIHAVEKVKQCDPFCGGPTKVGIINKEGKIVFGSRDMIDETAAELAAIEQKLIRLRKEQTEELFAAVVQRVDKKKAESGEK